MSPPLTVLVVESDPADGRLIQVCLQEIEARARVTRLPDGEAILHALAAGAPPPALLLLRADLPRATGQAVLRAVKAHPAWTGVPVLILGGAVPGEAATFYDLQAAACVPKPLDLDGWLRLLERTCQLWLRLPRRGRTATA